MYPERNTRRLRLLPTRVLFLLTLVMAAATTFVGAPTAWAADVTCTSVMSGGASGPLTIKGNVIVPVDAHCTLSFVNVTGNVQAAPGSTLLISAYTEPSTIGGNVEATDCYSALLEGTVTVGGNLQILGCHGNGPNGFQGPDIVINGNFQCDANSSNAARVAVSVAVFCAFSSRKFSRIASTDFVKCGYPASSFGGSSVYNSG